MGRPHLVGCTPKVLPAAPPAPAAVQTPRLCDAGLSCVATSNSPLFALQIWLVELFSGSQEFTTFAACQLDIPADQCLTIDYDSGTSLLHRPCLTARLQSISSLVVSMNFNDAVSTLTWCLCAHLQGTQPKMVLDLSVYNDETVRQWMVRAVCCTCLLLQWRAAPVTVLAKLPHRVHRS